MPVAVVAGPVVDAVSLVVTTSTGGTLTDELGFTLGWTLGTKLPVASSLSLLEGGTAAPPVGLVVVRRVVTLAPAPPVGVPMGQTVVPMTTSEVVSRVGQLVLTEGGHDVTVYQCVE